MGQGQGREMPSWRRWGGLATWMVVLTWAATNAFAIEAVGYGASREEAQQRAAAELVSMIQVRVQSVVESCVQSRGREAADCGSRVLKRTAADLPLLGLRYVAIKGDGEPHGAKAVLDSTAAVHLYRRKLADLRSEFAANRAALEKAGDGRMRHELLTRQVACLRSLTDHRLVAVALGESVDEPPMSEAELLTTMTGLEQVADSLAFAARILLKDIDGRVATVEAIVPAGSSDRPPFGEALGSALRAETRPQGAAPLSIRGDYRVLEDGRIDVTLEIRRLSDRKIIAVKTVQILPAAYAGYRATPLAPDVDRLIREGVVVTGDFRVDVTTDRGSRDLLFRDGESVHVLLRLNQPAYFFVVGHVVRESGEQFSYLLPMDGDAGGENRRDRFVRYLPPDQVNHLLDLGAFDVIAPFGTEHLQIVASTVERNLVLPFTRYDGARQYHVIEGTIGNAGAGIAATRGIIPKSAGKVMAAEGTLTFSTLPRP